MAFRASTERSYQLSYTAIVILLYQTLGAAGGIGFPQGRVQSCLIVPPTYVLPLSNLVHSLLPL